MLPKEAPKGLLIDEGLNAMLMKYFTPTRADFRWELCGFARFSVSTLWQIAGESDRAPEKLKEPCWASKVKGVDTKPLNNEFIVL